MSTVGWNTNEKDLIVYMMTSSNGNIFRVTGHLCGEFTGPPHKGQWRRALMLSLICVWINGWVNNGEAGDLRRHRAHYDVTVMVIWHWQRNDWSKSSWGLTHLTSDFSYTVEIEWIFYFACIKIGTWLSLQNFAHVRTVQLMWDMQNFIVIKWSEIEKQQNVISANFQLWVTDL